jgi:NADH dehydrogenase (ubiquinone) flavoprotein 1
VCALGDAAAWPVQGLIRRFKHVMEDRLIVRPSLSPSVSRSLLVTTLSLLLKSQNPEKFQAEKDKYFQSSWSGQAFANDAWAQQNGDGKIYK